MAQTAARLVLVFILLFAILGAAPPPQLLESIGSEFQVNTYTTGVQDDADVAFRANGGFVVVWASGNYSGVPGRDGSEGAIMARLFRADGSPAGNEFQVNTWTPGRQYLPAVAADSSGGFVVVWSSEGSGGSDSSASAVLGQRFGSDGQPAGGEFQINTSTLGYQYQPRPAYLEAGDFVVVWAGESPADGDPGGIVAQRFSASGNPLGGELAVNTVTTSTQVRPAVAATASGGFVVVWQNNYEPPNDFGNISIQLLDASGGLIDGEYQVNGYSTGEQIRPDVVAHPGGNLIVVWNSDGSFATTGRDTSSHSIQGRSVTIPPPPLSLLEQQVNTYTTGRQERPRIALDREGDPVVVWESEGSLGSDPDFSIQIRHGAAPEMQVNTYTTDDQSRPAIAADGHGRFVVVWDSIGSAGDDNSESSVQVQIFTLPIFVDGFESGSTSSWGSAAP